MLALHPTVLSKCPPSHLAPLLWMIGEAPWWRSCFFLLPTCLRALLRERSWQLRGKTSFACCTETASSKVVTCFPAQKALRHLCPTKRRSSPPLWHPNYPSFFPLSAAASLSWSAPFVPTDLYLPSATLLFSWTPSPWSSNSSHILWVCSPLRPSVTGGQALVFCFLHQKLEQKKR